MDDSLQYLVGVRITVFANGFRTVDRKLGQIEAVYVTEIHRLRLMQPS